MCIRDRQKLIAANASVGIAYTNMFPRLSLTAQYGVEDVYKRQSEYYAKMKKQIIISW